LPKPNYSFEKRQRELAKKRKKEEKAARKSQGRPDEAPGASDAPEDQEGIEASAPTATDEAPGPVAGAASA
jgi:hypothetical protein